MSSTDPTIKQRLARMEDRQTDMETKQTGTSGLVKDIHEALIGSLLHPEGMVETVSKNSKRIKGVRTQLYVVYTAAGFVIGLALLLDKLGIINII